MFSPRAYNPFSNRQLARFTVAGMTSLPLRALMSNQTAVSFFQNKSVTSAPLEIYYLAGHCSGLHLLQLDWTIDFFSSLAACKASSDTESFPQKQASRSIAARVIQVLWLKCVLCSTWFFLLVYPSSESLNIKPGIPTGKQKRNMLGREEKVAVEYKCYEGGKGKIESTYLGRVAK